MPATVPLAEFEAPVAEAVVAVLLRSGLPASLGEVSRRPGEGAEVEVLVPADRRSEAMAAMAASMEAVQEELRRRGGDGPGSEGRGAAEEPEEHEEQERPLLFERLRALGFLPLLLVPLLIVTLAQVRLPSVYMVAVVVGGMVVLYAWRDGRRHRDDG